MPVIGRISVGDGATFTPSVSSEGELSWTNNKNLENPATVDLAQAVLDSGVGLFLPLTGGTVTGSVEVTGGVTADITGDVTGNVTGNVTGDVTGDVTGLASENLPLTGGTVTGDVTVTGAITGDSVTSNSVNVKSGSVAPVNTLQRSTAYSVDDIVYTSALNAKYYLLCVTAGTTSATMPSFSGAGSNTEVTDGTVVWRVQTITSQEKAAGFPIGFEYFQTNPNVPAGSLPMLGGVYSRETYSDLWDWVQTQTGYLITDSAWVTLSNSQNGNVPFYSSGDGSTTFRVPSLKCWIKGTDGVETVGTYLDAGLPNITGTLTYNAYANNTYSATGALATSNNDTWTRSYSGSITTWNSSDVSIDASRSSSIYGNSTTVQPESIVGMWLVKAYGVIVDTGAIDEQQYIDDRFAAAKDYTDMEVETGVPTGCVQAFAGQNTPTGWLLCDGSAVSRVTYAKLFSVIGTSYGAGDGSTTFNLPNLIDKFVQGNAVSGTVKSAGLPNITGSAGLASDTNETGFAVGAWDGDGAFSSQNVGSIDCWVARTTNSVGTGKRGFDFNASRLSSIYGNSTTVQPPALTMRYIIKY